MNRVIDALVHAEATTLDDPHILVVRCVSSGEVTFAGPYPTGLAALVAADREMALLSHEPDEIEITVAALSPPV